MDDPRIGHIENGEVAWPQVDILGQPYTRPPAAMQYLDGQRFVSPGHPSWEGFVVLPLGMSGEKALEIIATFNAAPVKENKRGRGGLSGESEVAG